MAKFGTGSVKAMARQGLSELRGMVYPQSNVAQPTDHGMYGHPTQAEIARDREKSDQKDLDNSKQVDCAVDSGSILVERLNQAYERQSQERQQPDKGRDR